MPVVLAISCHATVVRHRPASFHHFITFMGSYDASPAFAAAVGDPGSIAGPVQTGTSTAPLRLFSGLDRDELGVQNRLVRDGSSNLSVHEQARSSSDQISLFVAMMLRIGDQFTVPVVTAVERSMGLAEPLVMEYPFARIGQPPSRRGPAG